MSGDEEPLLRVAVADPGTVHVGRVTSLQPDHVQAMFTPPALPRLAVGESTEIELLGLPERKALRVLTTLRAVQSLASRHWYTFDLADSRAFWNQLPHGIRQLIDLRQESRLPVSLDDRLFATMEAASVRQRARVADLSSGGIALVGGPLAAAVAKDWQEVRITLRLPNTWQELDLWGAIRSRHEELAWVRYGIEFLAERTRELARMQRCIEEYVQLRQRLRLAERR